MPTVDEEFLAAAKDFIGRQAKADKPFFVWFNSTRMHVFTHLKPESLGKTGKGIHADGMVEHDGMVGELLKQLDDLGIADNTIVLYTTDNGAEIALWPDGAMTPFQGEKGTTWEGGMRIPDDGALAGRGQARHEYNDIISLIDWFPTLCAAAGVPDIKEKMKDGLRRRRQDFKVHLDGYNFVPYFKGEEKSRPARRDLLLRPGRQSQRRSAGTTGSSASRSPKGNIATGVREVTGWAMITNLRMDPYERGLEEGGGAIEFLAQQYVVAGADSGEGQGVLLRLRPVPVSGGQFAQRRRHQLRVAAQQEAMKRLKEIELMKPR